MILKFFERIYDGEENIVRKKIVYFLFLAIVLLNRCLNFYIIPSGLCKVIAWSFGLMIIAYAIKNYDKVKKQKGYKGVQIAIVLISITIPICHTMYQQSILQDRVYIHWYTFLAIVFLSLKKITPKELYCAISLFSVLWMICWSIEYVTPRYMFAGAGFDFERKESISRGIARLKIAGGTFLTFWGFWNLLLYTNFKKTKNLYFFVLCLCFVVLQVSRQHIVAFIVVSIAYLIKDLSWTKKISLALICIFIYTYALPKIEIYRKLTELTENQMEANGNMRDDIRIKNMEFYFTEYEQNIFTFLFGRGQWHADSKFGQEIQSLISTRGAVPADAGFAGIYLRFGACGLLFCFCYFVSVLKANTSQDLNCIKLMVTFIFMTSVLSHEIDRQPTILMTIWYLAKYNYNSKYLNLGLDVTRMNHT